MGNSIKLKLASAVLAAGSLVAMVPASVGAAPKYQNKTVTKYNSQFYILCL